jgi:F-type H+/Na+-transporting ATPase subunit alpha
MSFRPEEVSAVLAQELERYEATIETRSVGTVLSVGDGIARLWGLEEWPAWSRCSSSTARWSTRRW